MTDKISGKWQTDKEIKELLRNIFHDIRAEAFKPFVLGLLHHNHSLTSEVKMSDEVLLETLRVIRTYLVRRRVMGLTQGENKNIVILSRKIPAIARGEESMIELLTHLFYKLRMPNDKEVAERLKAINFYEDLKSYSRFILGKIEEYNSKVSVDFRNRNVCIEHVMPQTLSLSWQEELGDNCREIHEQYLHNIGNLILTEFNSEIGNKTFMEKKAKIKTSNLHYRTDVIECKVWNEDSILEHQHKMVNWFLLAFPLPEEFRERDNWNTQELENVSFSPVDVEAGDIAKGNKPELCILYGKLIPVSNWKDIFLILLKYIKENSEYDFGYLLAHQPELFMRENAVLEWSEFKKLKSTIFDLETKYQTLNGVFWYNEPHIEESTLFVHTNISASVCINRMAKLMHKYNIERDDFIIELR